MFVHLIWYSFTFVESIDAIQSMCDLPDYPAASHLDVLYATGQYRTWELGMRQKINGANHILVNLHYRVDRETRNCTPFGRFLYNDGRGDAFRTIDLRTIEPPHEPVHTPVFSVFVQMGSDDAKCKR